MTNHCFEAYEISNYNLIKPRNKHKNIDKFFTVPFFATQIFQSEKGKHTQE